MDRNSILIWVGLFLSISATILTFSWDGIFSYVLAKQMRLTDTSRSFIAWKDTPVPLILKFYLFNWTNPEELMDDGFKPNLVEVGPYVFKEYYGRVNITWNENNTVSYRRVRRWYFSPELSNGSLMDNITTLNPVALTVTYMMRFANRITLFPLLISLRVMGQNVWITKAAGEFLYHGYSDPLLKMAAKFPQLAHQGTPGDKFAWFYKRNGSAEYEGVFNMETGAEDISRIGILRSWNYKNRTEFFEAECGQINGSSGGFYPPGLRKDKPIQTYSAEFCRTLNLDYQEDVEVQGLTGYKYVGSKKLLDSGTLYPENWCNCNGECVRPGVLNISACRYGAPAFVSYPHFTDADPYYLQKLNGMKPDPKKYKFEITVEPTTGIPLNVAARFQVNLLLQPSKTITLYKDVPTIFFPMMWFEETVTIPPAVAATIKNVLLFPVLGFYSSLALLLLGLIMLAIAILPKVLRRKPWILPHRLKRKPEEEYSEVIFTKENRKPLMTSEKKEIITSPEEKTSN